ncbi:MAG: CPBP family intramembrane glutamic endopeptidase [Polyangiaceae bacterium]
MSILGDRYQLAWLVVITSAVAAAAGFAFKSTNAGSAGLVAIYGGVTCALAIAGCIRAWRDGELGEWIRPKSGDFTRGFLAGAFLFGCAYVFTKFVIPADSPRVGWLARAYLQVGDPSTLREKVAYVSVFICVIAIAEEVLWRGLVTTLFAEMIGSRRAWIFAALLYSLVHLPTMWMLADPKAGLNPLVVFAALGCGLVWGALTRWTGRLAPAIVSHALFDWFIVMTFRLWGPSV